MSDLKPEVFEDAAVHIERVGLNQTGRNFKPTRGLPQSEQPCCAWGALLVVMDWPLPNEAEPYGGFAARVLYEGTRWDYHHPLVTDPYTSLRLQLWNDTDCEELSRKEAPYVVTQEDVCNLFRACAATLRGEAVIRDRYGWFPRPDYKKEDGE